MPGRPSVVLPILESAIALSKPCFFSYRSVRNFCTYADLRTCSYSKLSSQQRGFFYSSASRRSIEYLFIKSKKHMCMVKYLLWNRVNETASNWYKWRRQKKSKRFTVINLFPRPSNLNWIKITIEAIEIYVELSTFSNQQHKTNQYCRQSQITQFVLFVSDCSTIVPYPPIIRQHNNYLEILNNFLFSQIAIQIVARIGLVFSIRNEITRKLENGLLAFQIGNINE